ncbi:MAG: hypothetical protein RR501_07995, partial [Cloacibacillus sp.]
MERLIFKNKITKGLALFVILCLAACAQPAAAQTDAARQTEQSKPYTPAYEELLAPGAKSNADDMAVPLKPSAPASAAVEQEASDEEAPEAPKTPQNEVFLDADEVSYGENTGLATAEGNVKITNKQVRLFAPYAEYDANTNIVD